MPELNAVFEALIGSRGPEITLRPPGDLGLDPGDMTFGDVQSAAASLRCISLGFYAAPDSGAPRRVELNPERIVDARSARATGSCG